MKEFRVVIPEEHYQLLKFKQEGFPGIASINKSLMSFEPKEVFSWHCSVMIHFNDLVENGMPSVSDRTKAEEFEGWLDEEIKGHCKEKPNALFLGRITWNKTRELIWRIYKPDIVNSMLNDVIEKKEYDLPFDYRIDQDLEWKLTKWHLENHN